ncbi:MAG: DUF445 domain-containing protein [Selenomonas sp.]|uniref:DUF445 domain-containing protein n=1 Tax=Selenomonas sp. TaxID=2053611 RepID=UPI0025D3B9AD|nr:DUF445 domain-containing protein [Selenomonas sp.]MCR5437868.1 DUF445 domain-containing protein [Selenomonas sp.]
MQTKNKANLALGISAAGFIGTMAAGGTGFLPGLLHHGFLAATIGGLADWFAVTAIFHKPLGISYRTDILRRNRQRIMEAIVTFASDDLLSTQNIMRVIEEQDTARLLVEYLEHRGGRKLVHEVVETVMLRAVEDLDTATVAAELSPAIREGLQTFALEDIVSDLLEMLAEEEHSERILASLLAISQRLLESEPLQQVLLSRITSLRQQYEKDSAGRAFVLSSLGITDERILTLLLSRMQQQLKTMLAEPTESYASVKAGLENMLRALSQDVRLRAILQDRKEQLLESLDIEGGLARWLEANLKGEEPFWLPQVHAFLDARMDDFSRSEPWQRRFDRFVKQFVEDELIKHHDLIPGIIRERLDEFSDDELVAFVEAKVQDDLQMIRINGSLVGSLVGMGLYLVVMLLERMWGL